MTPDAPITCPTCRYNLDGVVGRAGALCPECGAWTDRHTLEHANPRIPLPWRLAPFLTPAVIGLVFIAGALFPPAAAGAPIIWTALACGFAFAFIIFFQILDMSRRRTPGQRTVLAALLAFLTTCVSLVALFVLLFFLFVTLYAD